MKLKITPLKIINAILKMTSHDIPEALKLVVQTYGAMVGETPPPANTQKCQSISERMKNATKVRPASESIDAFPEMSTIKHDKCDAQIVDQGCWDRVLEFYESFHDRYIDDVMEKTITPEQISKLVELELWFSEPYEPIPVHHEKYISWIDREKFKCSNGISSFCPKPIRDLLKSNHISSKYPSGWAENRRKNLDIICENHTSIKFLVPGKRANVGNLKGKSKARITPRTQRRVKLKTNPLQPVKTKKIVLNRWSKRPSVEIKEPCIEIKGVIKKIPRRNSVVKRP